MGPGDLAAQVEQAFVNVGTVLAAVGGSFDDVCKLTLYLVDWTVLPGAIAAAGGRTQGRTSLEHEAASQDRSPQRDQFAGW